MKMLLSLLMVPLLAAPAMAQGPDNPAFKPDAAFTRTLSAVNRIPEAPGMLAPVKPRTHVARSQGAKGSKSSQAIASARARGSADLPSFAIKGGGDSSQVGNGAGTHASTPAGNGAAASQPPVSFSFAASGQSDSRNNRYRGGVYMAAPF